MREKFGCGEELCISSLEMAPGTEYKRGVNKKSAAYMLVLVRLCCLHYACTNKCQLTVCVAVACRLFEREVGVRIEDRGYGRPRSFIY